MVLALVVIHVLARVLLHVLARVIIHVHDYYSKTCVLDFNQSSSLAISTNSNITVIFGIVDKAIALSTIAV